jgi:7-carboxy-7-deazaguanine synthase
MRIAELFYSVQGEGKFTGVPSVFIRTSGCNLRCAWCDTPYASWNPEGDDVTVAELVQRTLAYPSLYVVITGGEPAIAPGIEELCERLHRAGRHVTLETAGTVFKRMHVDLASISPKLSNSTPISIEGGRFAANHEAHRLRPDVVQQFIETASDFQLKFVVAEAGDVHEIEQFLSKLRGFEPADVMMMPEGVSTEVLRSREEWLVPLCLERGWRFCPRLHIQLFGNRRGT